jgi:hypothetical protein
MDAVILEQKYGMFFKCPKAMLATISQTGLRKIIITCGTLSSKGSPTTKQNHRNSILSMKFLLIFISLLFAGCSIQGSFRGLYSYYNKTKKENPNLLSHLNASDAVCDLTEKSTPQVYVINGIALKKCLSGLENALVYVWKPNCKSALCYPIEVIQQKCGTKNIDLFIVAEYYDAAQMNHAYDLSRPIFGIDTKFYGSNLTNKYLSRFIRDLTGRKDSTDTFYYHFNKGRLVNTGVDVYDLF